MTEGHYGWQGLTSASDEYSMLRFLIRQELANVRTTVPVKIIAVHGGGVSKPPTVDVQPLINQTDGTGTKTDHSTIYGIPVSRNQGSTYAIINDPHVGDVGHIHVSDRDMSALKANDGAQSNPGSFRRHSLADGVYVGAILNPADPTQYVQFTTTGINIHDLNGNSIVMNADGVTINGLKIDRNGNLTTPGGVQAGTGTGDSVTLQHHTHAGGPAPTPGT